MKLITPITYHSHYKGVRIWKHGSWFKFLDKRCRWNGRNTAKQGGTLAALKGDIDWYLQNGWV